MKDNYPRSLYSNIEQLDIGSDSDDFHKAKNDT